MLSLKIKNKNMFETSKDVLNLVLALSIAGVTVFICWLLYYFISSIRKLHDAISIFQKTLKTANEIVDSAKKKLKDSSTHLKLIGMLVQKVVEEVQNKRQKRKTKTPKAKKAKKK